MNTLADNALFEAYRAGHPRLTQADVARVCADLGWSGGVSESTELASESGEQQQTLRQPIAGSSISRIPLAYRVLFAARKTR